MPLFKFSDRIFRVPANMANPLGVYTGLLPDHERILVETDPVVRDVALQLATRFTLGRTWMDVDVIPGEEHEGWRNIDRDAVRRLAAQWIAAGAPIQRISQYIAVAILRVAETAMVASLAEQRRRLAMIRIVVHVLCGVLVAGLVAFGVADRLLALGLTQAIGTAILVMFGVWVAAAALAAAQRRIFDSRSAALVGLFLRRVRQAAVELEEGRCDPAVVLRRLRSLDAHGKLPDELWALLGAPTQSDIWTRTRRTRRERR